MKSFIPFDLEMRDGFTTRIPKLDYAIRSTYLKGRYLLKKEPSAPRLFRDSNVVFIHIPKNAGSSIVRALYPKPITHNSAQCFQILDSGLFEQVPSFAILRAPVDRFVSAYNYLRYSSKVDADRKFGDEVLAKYGNAGQCAEAILEDAVARQDVFRWSHFRPQTEFICDPNGKILVAHLGCVEHMQEFADFVSGVVGTQIDVKKTNIGVEKEPIPEHTANVIKALYPYDTALHEKALASEDKLLHTQQQSEQLSKLQRQFTEISGHN